MDPATEPTVPPIAPAVLQVIAELREQLAAHPDSPGARLALDGILVHFIQDARADEEQEGSLTIPRLEQLAALFPESPLTYLHLSQVSLHRQDHGAARRYAERGLQIQPDHHDLLFNRALALYAMADYDAAIVGFEQALALDPLYVWSYSNIGDAYRLLDMYDQAEQYLRRALELESDFAPALHNLSLLYHDREDWPGCIHYGLLALRHDPRNKEVHLAVGEACLSLKEWEAGLQHLAAATLADPDFVDAYESMSAAYANLAMYELSIGAAREALKRDPTSWMALANLGYAYARQGMFDRAVQAYEDALARLSDPDQRYKLYWELGWNAFLADQYDLALSYTGQAIDMRELPDLILFFNKGLILLALGRAQEANAVYTQAMHRAGVQQSHDVLAEAQGDLQAYLARTGQQVQPASAMARLLEWNADA